MNRIRLAFFIVFTVAFMAWLVARVRADEPLYFPTVGVAPKIEPQPLGNSSETPNSSPREVVMLVPNFHCNACNYMERQLATVPGIRITKRIDMTRRSWPWLSIPDTGRVWDYYHPVKDVPLVTADVVAILKAYPPKVKPTAKAGPKINEQPRAAGSDLE